MAVKGDPTNPTPEVVATSLTAGPSEQREVRLRFDESKMGISYANGFRTSTTPEEVILDCGLNMLNTAPPEGAPPELVLQVSNRVVMSFYVAKRLTIMLGQVIRQHEDLYGTIELDPAKRRKK